MADNIIPSVVTQVPLGLTEIEGLLLEDGRFAVAVQQAAILFSVRQDNVQRSLKALLGKDFQFVKTRAKRAARQNRPENALLLLDFERFARHLDRKGNQQARELIDQLVGLSLTQLFSDAFNIKFEKQERQSYLIARAEGKTVRYSMTDAIKDWCDRNGVPDKTQGYCVYCSDALNVHLFGKTSAQLKEERKVLKSELLRDSMSSSELRLVERIEDRVSLLVETMNIKPTDAINQVILCDVKKRMTRGNDNA